MSLESFNSEEITGEENDRVDESSKNWQSFSENIEPTGDESDLASVEDPWGLSCEMNGQLYLMFFLTHKLKD